MTYSQDEKKKIWDLVNEKSLKAGDTVDAEKVPGKLGLTLELCAGIIDKEMPEVEIASEEVEEECGYLVEVEKFYKIVTFPGSVGIAGGSQTLFCVEVTNKEKIGPGGGLVEEGEMIQVVEMSIQEAKKYLKQDLVNSPVGLLFGLQWYLSNKLNQ